MEVVVIGWPEDRPSLELDQNVFAYAGKFRMTNTGKAIARDDEEIIAAVSFSPDRTDTTQMWLRYLTVRTDRRGESIGPRLALAITAYVLERGYDRVAIAVNNPFAYEALYRAGFGYSGCQTGIAELVLTHRPQHEAPAYQDGLDVFRRRDTLSDEEHRFLARRADRDPPDPSGSPYEPTEITHEP